MASLIGVIVFLLVGGLASAWIFGVRLRREEAAAGIIAFSAMHWREFQRLVIQAIEQRGFHRVAAQSDPVSDDALIELQQADGEKRMLSTKHGAGYVLNTPAIGQFANAMRLRNATGGWMTTLGTLAPESIARARMDNIELLDGATLWSQIRPQLEPEQRKLIAADARKRANRHLLVAWGGAMVLGAAAWLLLANRNESAAASPDASAATTEATPAAPAPQAFEAAVVPDDPAQLSERRNRFADAVSTLPGVERAAWSTPSTLVVYLVGQQTVDKGTLCPLLEPFPELRASRLQLQPPRDSEQTVRFMQCHTY